MKRKSTMATVARRAEVAESTVSSYLNSGYVSAAVRSRMRAVVKEFNYIPSLTARNLSKGRKGCIGVVGEPSQGRWFMQLLAGIQEELSKPHLIAMPGRLTLHGHYDASATLGWIRDRRADVILLARSP